MSRDLFASDSHLPGQQREMIMTNGTGILANISKLEALPKSFLSAITDIGCYLARRRERQRQRQALARLDHRLLKDIGLSSDAALGELRKPFWR
jgi:uncharacterized protein YjiS (DUF1127 family)